MPASADWMIEEDLAKIACTSEALAYEAASAVCCRLLPLHAVCSSDLFATARRTFASIGGKGIWVSETPMEEYMVERPTFGNPKQKQLLRLRCLGMRAPGYSSWHVLAAPCLPRVHLYVANAELISMEDIQKKMKPKLVLPDPGVLVVGCLLVKPAPGMHSKLDDSASLMCCSTHISSDQHKNQRTCHGTFLHCLQTLADLVHTMASRCLKDQLVPSTLLLTPADGIFMGGPSSAKDETRTKKGRLEKVLGDICLMIGLPEEATIHFASAVDLCKERNDALWLASSLDAMAAACWATFTTGTSIDGRREAAQEAAKLYAMESMHCFACASLLKLADSIEDSRAYRNHLFAAERYCWLVKNQSARTAMMQSLAGVWGKKSCGRKRLFWTALAAAESTLEDAKRTLGNCGASGDEFWEGIAKLISKNSGGALLPLVLPMLHKRCMLVSSTKPGFKVLRADFVNAPTMSEVSSMSTLSAASLPRNQQDLFIYHPQSNRKRADRRPVLPIGVPIALKVEVLNVPGAAACQVEGVTLLADLGGCRWQSQESHCRITMGSGQSMTFYASGVPLSVGTLRLRGVGIRCSGEYTSEHVAWSSGAAVSLSRQVGRLISAVDLTVCLDVGEQDKSTAAGSVDGAFERLSRAVASASACKPSQKALLLGEIPGSQHLPRSGNGGEQPSAVRDPVETYAQGCLTSATSLTSASTTQSRRNRLAEVSCVVQPGIRLWASDGSNASSFTEVQKGHERITLPLPLELLGRHSFRKLCPIQLEFKGFTRGNAPHRTSIHASITVQSASGDACIDSWVFSGQASKTFRPHEQVNGHDLLQGQIMFLFPGTYVILGNTFSGGDGILMTRSMAVVHVL